VVSSQRKSDQKLASTNPWRTECPEGFRDRAAATAGRHACHRVRHDGSNVSRARAALRRARIACSPLCGSCPAPNHCRSRPWLESVATCWDQGQRPCARPRHVSRPGARPPRRRATVGRPARRPTVRRAVDRHAAGASRVGRRFTGRRAAAVPPSLLRATAGRKGPPHKAYKPGLRIVRLKA
jgi:hypothetical protein